MQIVKASDRTYIRDERGTMRVLDYNRNGVEESAILEPKKAPKVRQTEKNHEYTTPVVPIA